MQIIFNTIMLAFIIFLAACFLLALKKEIEKFKTIRKCIGKPVSSREVTIYIVVIIIPFILMILYKYKKLISMF